MKLPLSSFLLDLRTARQMDAWMPWLPVKVVDMLVEAQYRENKEEVSDVGNSSERSTR